MKKLNEPIARYTDIPSEDETRPAKDGTAHLYVVVCDNENYYVGITRRAIYVRMKEHFYQDGAVWTTEHEPQELILVARDVREYKQAETTLTLRMMVRHGYDSVRGGVYTQKSLAKPTPLRDGPPYEFWESYSRAGTAQRTVSPPYWMATTSEMVSTSPAITQ